jgi:signal transduction histidine kinase
MSAALALLAGETRTALVDSRDLDALLERLEHLAPEATEALEALGQPFHPTLREAAAGPLSRELRHDLRVSLTALRTMADHLGAPPSSRPLSSEALRLRYTQVDLAAHLRAWVEAFRPLAQAREIQLEVEAPDARPCTLDLGKIEIIVLNLLFNAFKYTPSHGRVAVRLDAPAGDADAVLSVRDDGPPVPEVEWHALFDRARQIERNVFSLGFNLGVSLAYCQLHGGTLELRHPRDGGCAFAARWSMHAPRGAPLAPAPPIDATFARAVADVASRELDDEATLGARPIDDSRPTVLVIESARALHRALVECLRDTFNTVSAFDGREGSHSPRERAPISSSRTRARPLSKVKPSCARCTRSPDSTASRC